MRLTTRDKYKNHNLLILLIFKIKYTNEKIGGAGPTPKPRTTLFSALSYYPNSLWERSWVITVSVPTYKVLQK